MCGRSLCPCSEPACTSNTSRSVLVLLSLMSPGHEAGSGMWCSFSKGGIMAAGWWYNMDLLPIEGLPRSQEADGSSPQVSMLKDRCSGRTALPSSPNRPVSPLPACPPLLHELLTPIEKALRAQREHFPAGRDKPPSISVQSYCY